MIEQMKASIMRTVHDLFPSLKLYDKETNGKIKSPSLYFNEPFAIGFLDNKDQYGRTFTINILILHDSTNKAINVGNEILNAIMANKSRVYLYNQDGTISSDYLQINEIQVEESDEDSARLQLVWNVKNSFN